MRKQCCAEIHAVIKEAMQMHRSLTIVPVEDSGKLESEFLRQAQCSLRESVRWLERAKQRVGEVPVEID